MISTFLFNIFILPLTFLMSVIFHGALQATENHGVAILILSAVISTLMLPLYSFSKKWQQNNQDKLLSMQPTLSSINRHYKGQERYFYIKTLYRQHRYHPIHSLKASMGLLLQIPIFMAAYHFLFNLKSLDGISFMFLKDLGRPDTLAGGINILPFVMTAINLLSVFMSGWGKSTSNKASLLIIPFAFLVLLYHSPSGLTLYWTMNNIFYLINITMHHVLSRPKKDGDPTSDHKRMFSINIFDTLSPSLKIYLLSLAQIFLILFILNPLTLLSSTNDFMINIPSYLFTLFLFLLFFSLFFILLFHYSSVFFKKCLTLFSLFFSTMIFIYSIFIKKNYGLMDHFTLHFPQTLIQTPLEIMIESLLLLVLFIILLFLLSTFRKQLLQYQMILLLAISLAMVIELLGLPRANPKLIHQSGFTVSFNNEQEKMLSFSKEKNILVFLLDGFSGGYINKFYKEDPLMFDEFTGFTFYPNTLSTSTATWSSIAAILGGEKYSVQFINQRNEKSIHQEITEAYNLIPSTLLQHDFDVSFFNPFYGPDLDSDIFVSDLTTYAKYFQKNHPFWSYKMTHNQVMAMISLFRSAPLFLRKTLYNNGRWLGAYTSNHLVSSATAAWGFFDALIEESRIHENGKTFKFIHLKCPHFPHILDDRCEINPRQSRYHNDAACALKKIRLFLQWMKKNNIYDISKIVILSDHGWWTEPSEDFHSHFTKEIPPGYEHRFMPSMVQPLLMVKDFNQNTKFTFSNTLLSNSDLPSMICSAIESGCHNIKADPTKSPIPNRTLIISNALIPKNLDNEKKFNVMGQYRVQRMIFDPANWKKIR